MKIITAYIIKKCLFNTFLILLAFVVLFSIFNIIGQVGDIGKGEFNFFALLWYVILQVPNAIYLLLPLAILIGVILAMLTMVNYSEYAIIRTSGISLRKITVILLIYGACFSLITFIFGELVAPVANNYAQLYKKNKTHETISTQLHSGIWTKDGTNRFVNIKQILPDSTIIGINIVKYDKNLQIQDYTVAESGQYDNNKNQWILSNVTNYLYTAEQIFKTESLYATWNTSIDPKYFSVLIIAPEDMSVFGLMRYMTHLNRNHQSILRYDIAFWNKLIYPLSCISMALIALAFVPNNRRNINLGGKLFTGIMVGIVFFFVTKLLGFLALIFHLNAILSAVTPTLILFILGWYFVLRKE
jgi:lipopolysaccharide export system permease protein